MVTASLVLKLVIFSYDTVHSNISRGRLKPYNIVCKCGKKNAIDTLVSQLIHIIVLSMDINGH